MFYPSEIMSYCNPHAALPISICNFCHEVENIKHIHCHHAFKKLGTLYYQHVLTVFFNHPRNMLFKYTTGKKVEECVGVNITSLIIVEYVKAFQSDTYKGLIMKTEHSAGFIIQSKENENNPIIYKGIIEDVIVQNDGRLVI